MTNISIVIPTYNRKNYLSSLLNEIKTQNISDDIYLNIIVVVDGSTDGTTEMLKKEFPKVHIVMGTGDWWYTKSMNEGFKYALNHLNPDFILTLNDDIEIEPDFVQNMMDAYRKVQPTSIIGAISVSIDQPYRITNSGNYYRNKLLGLYRSYLPFLSEVNLKELKGLKPTITLPGRGMLIPYAILKELNYFDESFVQYHSDTDFCLRARKKGYEVYINWEAVIFSYINLTSSSSSFKKQSFKGFLNSFFDKYSRNYLPSRAKFMLRHQCLLLFPLLFILSLTLNFKNYFLKKNLVQ